MEIYPPTTNSGGAPCERSLADEIATVLQLNDGTCGNCDSSSEVTFHCNNCDELFCNFCAVEHKRIQQTKDHKLTRFHSARFKSTSISDSLYSSPRTSSTPSPHGSICDTHLEPISLFCDNCLVPICTDCKLTQHCNHQHTQYQQMVENAILNNQKLSEEALNTIAAISRTTHHIHSIVDSLDYQAYQATKDVHQFTQYLQSLLDKKRDEVINRINKTRKDRVDRLSRQVNNLRISQSKLGYIASLLAETANGHSPIEMVVANEQAAKQLNLIRAIQNELFPCENENINFLYDKSQFRELVGLTESSSSIGSNVIGAIGTAPGPSTSSSSVMPFQQNVRAPQPQQRDVSRDSYDKIPTLATDLFRFQQSMPSCRPVFGIVATITVRDNGRKPPIIFGNDGDKDGELCRPWGVCCSNSGNLFVADRSNNRIQVFNTAGVFLYKFGRPGKGPGEFDRPAGITISPEGNVIVADKDNHRIQVFKMDGTFMFTFGERGSDDGQFNYPWDVACNIQGNIVVSDTRNHRIQMFSCNGVFLNKYGFEPGMWKHFDSPRGVCFTPNGHVAVTDFNNHRVVVIDRSLSKAQYFGHLGHDSRDLCRPQGIVCDDHGKILVADSRNNRVQVYDNCGRFLFKLGHPNAPTFDRPSGICLTPDGNVVVVDFGNNRVQIY